MSGEKFVASSANASEDGESLAAYVARNVSRVWRTFEDSVPFPFKRVAQLAQAAYNTNVVS